MADDITLTVRVRDLTRGDFDRLEGRLNRMKRDLQGVNRSTASAGMHSKQLGQDIDKLNNSFKKMERTGSLSRRELTQMRTTLDQMSRSAFQAARNGEITGAKFRSLTDEIARTRAELDHLDRGLRNHNNTTRTTIRVVNGLTRSVTTNSRSIDGNTRTITTWRNNVNRSNGSMQRFGRQGTMVGKVFGNMRAKLIGTAVVLVASLLPTIGALAPMLAGLTGIVGVAALAFMGLNKPTKMLSKEQKDFLKGIKPLTKEFANLQLAARKAVLPGLTKSFKDIGRAVQDLNPIIKIAGKGFSDLVGKIARGISSDAFMKPFIKNMKMGIDWVQQFGASIGKFAIAFFDFGTKSQPALTAWQDLLGGFLDRGLPSMFKNMESGISGASDYLFGLSALINDGLLPGLGSLIGKFMEAFGPTIGQMLEQFAGLFDELAMDIGNAFVALSPVGKVIGSIASQLMDLNRIGFGVFFDTLTEIGGALMKTFTDVFSGSTTDNLTNGLKGLSDWVQRNEGTIRNAFTNIAITFVSITDAIVGAAPMVIGVLEQITNAALTFIGVFVHGASAGLGWIPEWGDKIKGASKKFDDFAATVRNGFDTAKNKSKEFADKAHDNLARVPLSLKFDAAKRNLEDLKKQLDDPRLTKKRRAQLEVQKEQAERALASAKHGLDAFDRKKAKPRIDANTSPFFARLGAVIRAHIPKKVGQIGASAGGFWSTVKGLVGRTLGTSYINVKTRYTESHNSSPFNNANGSVMKFFANGGENHVAQIAPAGSWRIWGEPETGGESYIPLSPTKRVRSRKIAEDTVDILGGQVEWFARGGHRKPKQTKAQKAAKKRADAEKQARHDAEGDLTISHFGKMAGYKNDEFRHALGLPDALGSLVDSLNHWRSVILKSTHGGIEKHLLKQLDKAGKSLIKYDKQLTKVDKSLDKAKTNLDNLKQSSAALKESVTSGVMSATDITRVANGDKNVTMADIMSTMQNSVDKSSAFSSALAQLKKRGVSKEIIAQIAQAGIEGGGLETAGTILTASDDQIKKMNEQQKKINKNAKNAGKTAADAMYAAGIKAAEGMIHGLEKKKKHIEKAMMDIAKAMEKAIKKALGIKSPSRVMMEVGHQTAEGFAVGIKKNNSANQAWDSMLTTQSSTNRSGGGGPQVVQLVVSGRVLDEVILDSNRRTVRTRGGNVQTVYGR